jgi:hypothetical protein
MINPKVMSVGSWRVLEDMIELEMYLVAQPQQRPWHMLPRGTKKLHIEKKPYSDVVESKIAAELVDERFIEATSSRTFVVSTSGLQFYRLNVKSHLGLTS